MSAFGTKRTCRSRSAMSAIRGKADIDRTMRDLIAPSCAPCLPNSCSGSHLRPRWRLPPLFVSVATIIAERLGAAVGALVATLPVSAGPVYVFLALDHDSTFISASAVASLALNTATAIFITVYVLIAQRRSLWKSVSPAFTAWLAVTLALGPVQWSAASAFILNAVVFAICVFIVEPFSRVGMPPTTRTWHDFVLRAGIVTLLVGAVLTLSFRIGPTGSG